MALDTSTESFTTPRTRFWVKFAVLALVTAFIAGYAFFLAVSRRIGPDNGLSLQTNDYRWYFFFDLRNVQRWTAGAAAALVFSAAALKYRQRNFRRHSPRWKGGFNGWGLFIAQAVVLTFAVWVALYHTFNLAGWDWFFLISAVIGAVGLLRIHSNSRWRSLMDRLVSMPRMPLLLIASAATLIMSFSWVHCGQAIVTDAQSQIAQARLILSGKFRILLSEQLLEAAQLPNFSRTNPTFSQYPPGHILLLIPFVAAGFPANALNILCGIVTVYFAVKICRCMCGSSAAVLTGLLLIVSPLFLVMGSSAMNHGTTAMMLILCAWAFYQAVWRCRHGMLWVGVLALCWAGITRPLTALAHVIVWAPVLVAHGWRLFSRFRPAGHFQFSSAAWQNISSVAAAGLVPLSILAAYNALTTGNPFLMGYVANDSQMHRLGFYFYGPYSYTPVNAAHNVVSDVMSLSDHMFGWPFSSWVLLFGWLLLSRFSPGELVIAALIVAQFVLYRFYHFYDLLLGPRFSSELMPFFAILGGIGLSRLLDCISRPWRGIVVVIVGVFLISALVGGIIFWRGKLSMFTTKHVAMEKFMKNSVFRDVPRVIVVRPDYGETAGDYLFDKEVPVWFISSKAEAAARRAPELRNYRWVHPVQFQ